MSKLQKIFIGIFCAGVLLCGVGTGVAFTEFSALAYGGKLAVGKTDMRTESFDVTYEYEAGEEQVNVAGWYQWNREDVKTDKTVPVNTVRFCITYNAERVEPYACWNGEEGVAVVSWHWKDEEDDVALMMQAKDLVLENLREGKIVSLEVLGMEDVTVLVNPADEGKVRLVY